MAAPKLDKRTRQDVARTALKELAPLYTPLWAGADDPGDPGHRLIELFARLAELLIERLNRVPERNFLSFLELTGVERFPGAPAEVPVTFLVSKRAPLGGMVPAGTQVATTQTQQVDALVFETRRDFYASPAALERVVALLPGADRFIELPAPPPPADAAALASAAPTSLFTGAEPALRAVDHVLYLGSEALFGRKDEADIRVTFGVGVGTFPPSTSLVWRRYDKAEKAWTDLGPPGRDDSVSGQVTFTFQKLAGVDKVVVDGIEDFWIAARFTGPFDASETAAQITAVEGSVVAPATPTTRLDAAFHNSNPLDVSKPFHPFGRRPAYGDAFYFTSEVAFGPDVDTVGLTFTIRAYSNTKLADQFKGLPNNMSVRTIARWQYLDTNGQWVTLQTFDHEFVFAATSGAVTRNPASVPAGTTHPREGTFLGGNVGTPTTLVSVSLTGLQGKIGLNEVHGVVSRWLRVLLVSDHPYGRDGVLTGSGTTTAFVGPLFILPTIEDVSIQHTPGTTPVQITNLKTLNDFEFRDHPGASIPLHPFRPVASGQVNGFEAFGSDAALYFAFDRPFGAVFVSLFFDLAGPASSLSSPLEGGNPNLAWEYWSAASGWAALDVIDETLDLTTSGTVGFVGPEDAAPAVLFAQLDTGAEADPVARWWFRARLASGRFDRPPTVRGVYLNTVAADNLSTQRTDLLVGSSNGEREQVFALVRGPVLAGELWVREPELPSADEIDALEAEYGASDPDRPDSSPVDEQTPGDVGERQVWVRWQRVTNFETSGPRSRHYTLDSVAGIVTFGNGIRGLIPPMGRNNLVIRGFQTGGGEAANRHAPPLAIKELKTSLPFIDRVFNVQAASAGASPWTLKQLEEFGPQFLKNRGRPVAKEDYEWMVRQRFSQVARVRCLPTLAPAPDGRLAFRAGSVTVLVVPKSTARRPQPDQGLIRKIREFLVGTALANLAPDIHVIGADYVAVDIEATLVPIRPELASVVARKAAAALEDLLHPLTGGENRTGYGFGRDVYLSEAQAVLERIEEVDHVVSAGFLDVRFAGADIFEVASNQLASSGTHQITV